MKTLLLASNGNFITETALKILPEVFKNMKMAYITTAGKKVSDREYLKYRKTKMRELKFNFQEIDIDGKDMSDLRQLLKDKNVIYVEGGNSYFLLKCIRESGFEKVVRELIENGVAYFGSSAGSYVATPSIVTATWKNPHKFDRCGVTDFTAMKLVPFLTFVHYLPEYKKMLKEKVKDIKYPIRILKDGQGLLVQGSEVNFVGEGEKITI